MVQLGYLLVNFSSLVLIWIVMEDLPVKFTEGRHGRQKDFKGVTHSSRSS